MSKRNLITELYLQLTGIQGVADSMPNIGEVMDISPIVAEQIHGFSASIIALSEKVEKLLSEIEQEQAGKAPSDKTDIMSNLPEQPKTDTLSDMHDQAIHVAGLAKAADTMIVAACIDGNGLYSVITTLKADTQELADNLEAVA